MPIKPAPKPDVRYAAVAWTAEDIEILRPHWTIEQCEEWLGQNEKYIRDRLIELGWEVIECMLPPKEDREPDDDEDEDGPEQTWSEAG